MSNATKIVPATKTKFADTENYWPIPSSSGTTYYTGSMLGVLASDGKAYKFDDTQALQFLGLMSEQRLKIDSDTAANRLIIKYDRPRLFSMPLVSGTPSRLTDIGKICYAADDQHVQFTPTTYGNVAGVCVDVLVSKPEDTTGTAAAGVVIWPMIPGMDRLSGDSGSRVLTANAATTTTYGTEALGAIVLVPNTTAVTINLPAVANCSPGDSITFIKTTSDVAAFTLDGNASENVNGSTTYASATSQYSVVTVITDGTAWYVDVPSLTSGATTFTGDVTLGSGADLVFSGTTGQSQITLTDNLADSLSICEGSNDYLVFVTTDSGEKIQVKQALEFPGSTGTNLIKLTDNLASALDITEASNSYLKFTTTNSSESVVCGKNLTLSSVNIITDTTGTKIATATTQKLGFFNASPVAQPAANTDATTGAAGSTNTVYLNTTFTGSGGTAAFTIGGVVTALKALGLLAV